MLHKAHILTLFRDFHKCQNHAATHSIRLISSDWIANNCSQNEHRDRHQCALFSVCDHGADNNVLHTIIQSNVYSALSVTLSITSNNPIPLHTLLARHICFTGSRGGNDMDDEVIGNQEPVLTLTVLKIIITLDNNNSFTLSNANDIT